MAGPLWKATKRGGNNSGDIMCFSCQWYQPYRTYEQPENGQLPLDAEVYGYCRGKSPQIANMNMLVFYDAKTGYFRTQEGGSVGPLEALNEVMEQNATQFWCRTYVRTNLAFKWPPSFS